MSCRWRKLGRIYAPADDARHPKLLTHAANPVPVHLEGDVYRVFFSGRDQQSRSSVGAVDIDLVTREVVAEHAHPFFEHGPIGSFYADGVSLGNTYVAGGVRHLTFMGWQAPGDAHWRGDIGRLVVTASLTLTIETDALVLGSDETDPISLSYPWVLADAEGYRMWYGSTRTWDAGNGEMVHVIHQAWSRDGQRWVREGLAVPFEVGRAQTFSRPTIARDDNGGYEMWFSYRSGSGTPYRIGYAQSEEGRTWELALPQAGIDVSPTGWDSEMIEYPFVFDHRGSRYLLYNGNGYGRTGFGLAIGA